MKIIRSQDTAGDAGRNSTFVVVHSSAGRFYLSRTSEGKILYNAKGEISLNIERQGELDISSGKLFFIPPSSRFTIRVQRDSSFYIYRLSLKLHFTESSLPLQWLYGCRSNLQSDTHGPLDTHPRIRTFFSCLGEFIEDELCGHLFYDHKARELLLMMRHYYEAEQLAMFFRPIIGRDHEFSDFVLENYRRHRTVQELAEASCYSLSSFNKLFRKNFGCAPYTWINRQRANDILNDLTITNTPIKQICSDHGFGSLSQFTTFCKRHFGVSPRRLRELHTLSEEPLPEI